MKSDKFFKGSSAFDDNRLSPIQKSYDHQIDVSGCGVWSKPSSYAPYVTELLYGEKVQVLEEKQTDHDYLSRITSMTDGYTGWIHSGYLRQSSGPANFWISNPLSHLYEAEDIKSPCPESVSMMGLLTISNTEIKNDFLCTDDNLYIKAKHVRPVGHWFDDPLDVALQFMHVPYLWGGRTAVGLDCSALIQLAFAACGKPLHRDSDLQFKYHGARVTAPQRGDLAFFPGHVGIMLDADNILHANATHMKVTINPLKEVIEWVRAEGHSNPFLGFKRICIQ